jgi:hypothetical protein
MAFPLVVVVMVFVHQRRQIDPRLSEALAELDRAAPGWRMQDLQAARAVPPEAENGARVVLAAAKLLPPDWAKQQAEELFNRRAPEELLPPELSARLGAGIAVAGPALAEARRLADLPDGRYDVPTERNVLRAKLPHLVEVRRVARLLRLDAMRQAQAGDMKQALTSCRAILNAARSVGDEPAAISQLVRVAVVTVACSTAERVLAQGQAADSDLAALQRLLEQEDRYNGLLTSMRAERAVAHEVYDGLETGDVPFNQLFPDAGSDDNWFVDLYLSGVGGNHYRAEHPLMLSLMTRCVETARLPLYEQAEAERQFDADVRPLCTTSSVLKMLLPAVGKFGYAERRKHADVRCTILALAAERYRRRHGDWPKSPEQLVPEFLAAIPLDPFDGEPLRCRRLEEGLVIYAVNQDGEDDGGALDDNPGIHLGTDIGCRLWDVKRRRQPPRPPEKAPEGQDAPGGPPP